MIEDFAKLLTRIETSATHETLADILWLAKFLPSPASPAIGAVEPGQRPATDDAETPRSDAPLNVEPSVDLPPERPPSLDAPPAKRLDRVAGLYPRVTRTETDITRQTSPIRIPVKTALSNAIEISRAMRPLARRYLSRRLFVMDDEATAEQIAEGGPVTPVTRPLKERWFKAEVVVEGSRSMVVWHREVREFLSILARQGAFADVRRWTLSLTEAGAVLRSPSAVPHGPGELKDPTARRLVFVLTDGVSEAWQNGRLPRVLHSWARTTPVVIVQMLPERLWLFTAIGVPSAEVSSPVPGVANIAMTIRRQWWDAPGALYAVPITPITLDAPSIHRWAATLMGAGLTAPAILLAADEIDTAQTAARPILAPEAKEASAEERVQRFRAMISPEAYDLAVFLSAVPLTLPVISLVQRELLPQTRQVHVAEVFVGGIVERVTAENIACDANQIEFDFCEGVRDVLHDSLRRSEAVDVLVTISNYVEKHFGQALDFGALIADPDGAIELPEAVRPFARIGMRTYKRFLGHIEILATQSEEAVAEPLLDVNATSRNPNPSTVLNEIFARSRSDPEGFWGEAAEAVTWYKKWDKVLDDSNKPFYRWFKGGIVNTCYNALDRHVEGGRADQAALIYDSPVTNTIRTYSYRELRDEVAKFAGVLQSLGVGKGDRVIVYMPMIAEAPMAMLACARIGAVHSVVFGGFASNELAVRINDAQPKVIVTASCGIEVGRVISYQPLIEAAVELADHKPSAVVVKQRTQKPWELKGSDVDWDAAVAKAQAAECVPVAATDPLYILYTSSTTGQPKGVVRDNGGHMVALTWTMKAIYGVNPGEAWWAASDVGWVVGHSYIVYAPLLYGATTIVYEGKPVGTPDAGAFWRVISEHNVVSLCTTPTAFRAIKRDDPKAELIGKYDLSKFRILFMAGERTDPDTLRWAEDAVKRPVIDHWWQTETGWAIAANCRGLERLPVKAGSPTRAVPGWNVQVLEDFAMKVPKEVPRGQSGEICVKLPLPPGALLTLWNNDERFVDLYLNKSLGYYATWDYGSMDEDGYVYIMGRADDVINVAGHRLSTGAMEEVLVKHPDVAECIVVGVADSFKGQLPVGFMVLKAGVTKSHDDIVKEVVQMVRAQIGPVAAFKTATVVDRLPKTRSGAILRGTVQRIANNEPWKMPAAIDDPNVLDEIKDALESIGYAGARTETS